MLTDDEKIKQLEELKRLNFKENWCTGFNKKWVNGLCALYQDISKNQYSKSLQTEIPEIFLFRTIRTNQPIFWWTYKGIFFPWYERHVAISKTIKYIKNNQK